MCGVLVGSGVEAGSGGEAFVVAVAVSGVGVVFEWVRWFDDGGGVLAVVE